MDKDAYVNSEHGNNTLSRAECGAKSKHRRKSSSRSLSKRRVLLVILIILLTGVLFVNIYSSNNAPVNNAPVAASAQQSNQVTTSESAAISPAVPIDSSGFEIGSYVLFGCYPQNNGDKLEPIEWQVLDNDGKQALLLSRYGLNSKPFHHMRERRLGWRDCDLRRWLNSSFLSRAFNEGEQKRIVDSIVYTGNNPNYGTKGCGETRDKVFCLSLEEAWKYFGNVDDNYGCSEKWHSDLINEDWWINRARACKATKYAVEHGVLLGKKGLHVEDKTPEWWFDNCFYWLRSPGDDDYLAARVSFSGAACSGGADFDSGGVAVRPALWVSL